MSATKKSPARDARTKRDAKTPTEKTAAEDAAPPKPKRAAEKKPLLDEITDAAKHILKSKRAKPAEAKTEVTAETHVRRTFTRHKKTEPPAILSEGDSPAAPPISGPGQKYSLGSIPPSQNFGAEAELPESYGTKKLFLTARDPHWLYAHWDLTREQQLKMNAHLPTAISFSEFTRTRLKDTRLTNPRPSRIAPLVHARRARGRFLCCRTWLLFRTRKMDARFRFQRNHDAARCHFAGDRHRVRHHSV